MVASVDGATARGATSAALGGGGDREVFAAIRRLADVVLVGASTLRAELYRPPPTDEAAVGPRRRVGASGPLRIAVVTRSLALPIDAELFSSPANRPLIVTAAASDTGRRRELAAVADVIVAGDHDVDLTAAVAELADAVGPVVLAEGGPRLNGQLVACDLLDEVNVTVAPLLVGGASQRMAAGGDEAIRTLELVQVMRAADELFIRYRRPAVR